MTGASYGRMKYGRCIHKTFDRQGNAEKDGMLPGYHEVLYRMTLQVSEGNFATGRPSRASVQKGRSW